MRIFTLLVLFVVMNLSIGSEIDFPSLAGSDEASKVEEKQPPSWFDGKPLAMDSKPKYYIFNRKKDVASPGSNGKSVDSRFGTFFKPAPLAFVAQPIKQEKVRLDCNGFIPVFARKINRNCMIVNRIQHYNNLHHKLLFRDENVAVDDNSVEQSAIFPRIIANKKFQKSVKHDAHVPKQQKKRNIMIEEKSPSHTEEITDVPKIDHQGNAAIWIGHIRYWFIFFLFCFIIYVLYREYRN